MPLNPDATGGSNMNKYGPPDGAPPNYNSPVHHDAGPYYPPQSPASPAPNFNNQVGPYNNYNNGPLVAPDPTYGGYYNNNPQGPYGPPAQGYYGPGPAPGGYYGQPQQMHYGQQPQPGYPGYGYGPQPQYGYYADQRGGPSAGEGICAGLLGALACCCCLDLLF